MRQRRLATEDGGDNTEGKRHTGGWRRLHGRQKKQMKKLKMEETTGAQGKVRQPGSQKKQRKMQVRGVKRSNPRWKRRKRVRQKKQRKMEETTGPSKDTTEDGGDNRANGRWSRQMGRQKKLRKMV